MKKTTIEIKGMHCRSCELLIESKLKQIKGVQSVEVSQKKGRAEIQYSTKHLNYGAVKDAVHAAGYEIGREEKPWISHHAQDYIDISMMAAILIILYFFLKSTNVLDFSAAQSSSLANLSVVLLIGLTAGISTCMALVGGLVLGVSSRFAELHPQATAVEKFRPHLFFNLGRIVSYFILGGVIGAIGSVFQLSFGFVGFMTIIVGLVMLVLGLQLTELFPRLNTITMPKTVSKLLHVEQRANEQYSDRNAIVLGALTFFLPCGFTQMMQIYAMSSGSFATGALTMGLFAIGTAPGLLGIGGLTAIIKGTFARNFFKFAGLVVIALSVFNIQNGMTLAGIKISINGGAGGAAVRAPQNNDVQVLKTAYRNKEDIQPNTFIVKAGQPVRMEVDVQENGYGCMGSFAIPGLSKQIEMLVKGKTLVYDFTPTSLGEYAITCAMGIPRGKIVVN